MCRESGCGSGLGLFGEERGGFGSYVVLVGLLESCGVRLGIGLKFLLMPILLMEEELELLLVVRSLTHCVFLGCSFLLLLGRWSLDETTFISFPHS